MDAPVYTSYRGQYVGTGIPDVQLSHTVSGTYSYRNPVYGLFFSINPVFTRSKDKGFMRLNVGCPRENLRAALESLRGAVRA